MVYYYLEFNWRRSESQVFHLWPTEPWVWSQSQGKPLLTILCYFVHCLKHIYQALTVMVYFYRVFVHMLNMIITCGTMCTTPCTWTPLTLVTTLPFRNKSMTWWDTYVCWVHVFHHDIATLHYADHGGKVRLLSKGGSLLLRGWRVTNQDCNSIGRP